MLVIKLVVMLLND